MMKAEFDNLETYVLLDWLVADFESKSVRYNLIGDSTIIQNALQASIQGRILLATLKKPVQEISNELQLDIDQETIHTEVNGNWVNISFLSFGTEMNELTKTYAVHFIEKNMKLKMNIEIPPLKFKIFYLPQLPIATTSEGHIMHTQKGFTSIRRKRIEINVHPPRDWKSIFDNMVHEIFHVYLLKESSIDDTESVESKVEAHVKTFFEKCQNEWKSERSKIIDDLKNILEKKLTVFEEVDSRLKDFYPQFFKAKRILDTIGKLYDAVLIGKVKIVPM